MDGWRRRFSSNGDDPPSVCPVRAYPSRRGRLRGASGLKSRKVLKKTQGAPEDHARTASSPESSKGWEGTSSCASITGSRKTGLPRLPLARRSSFYLLYFPASPT